MNVEKFQTIGNQETAALQVHNNFLQATTHSYQTEDQISIHSIP